ncbi:GNAT family N-acetyltransferase [Chitinophaga ginsengisoli]|uniref:RimJ/RimL family protein N-acetyltransferase n=1 Tax=Chitinophaga ginsengisoli TaxID=363837 RepID=A0A2P8GLS7_9BACT|nr:GNAT family N-acetyltransferase [Chitinophaga ginsengisoli]PSL34910.1 RimJ/RimL family protein N-acetyltransferase [Chitinophaga ginsengisoli]
MPKAINDIITPRLILRLLGEEVSSACLNNDFETAQHLLHATIPEEFFGELSVLQRDRRLLQEDPEYKPWASRGIILKGEMKMIGLIRFHSSPCFNADTPYREGAVELGYRILSDYRRKGYAREAVFAITNWAEEVFSVRRFIASISPENLPSLALAQSFGFVKVDEVMDEVDGLEHVYMLERIPAE